MIELTESAVSAINQFIASSEQPESGLRIAVIGGGCSGYQYSLGLEVNPSTDDTIVEYGDLKVYVDGASAPMLEGVTMDYVDSIEGSGFKFSNPNASNSCGCGSSFSCDK